MPSSLIRRIRNFLRQPWRERALFAVAWLLLGIGRGMVLLLPFRRIAPLLGRACGPRAEAQATSAHQQERARVIGRCVRWAARYTPWNSNCFAQAICARLLLGLGGVPCIVYFGVARDAGQNLQAHAWTRAGTLAVTGGDGFARFAVVGAFASGSER